MNYFRISPWPRSGPPQRLYIQFFSHPDLSVFAEERGWPRDGHHTAWKITVTGIDPRFDPGRRVELEQELKREAHALLCQWLAREAPLADPQALSWQELCRFARTNSNATPQRQRRYRRRAG